MSAIDKAIYETMSYKTGKPNQDLPTQQEIEAALSVKRAYEQEWRPIGELEKKYKNSSIPVYFLVLTSYKNIFMATAFDGDIKYVTPIDGITDDYKAYGVPSRFQPLPSLPKELK